MNKSNRNQSDKEADFLKIWTEDPPGGHPEPPPEPPLQEREEQEPLPLPEESAPAAAAAKEPESGERKPRSAPALRKTVGDIVRMVIVLAAIAVIIFKLLLPVFQVYGSNMDPTLRDGDYVLALRQKEYRPGDIIVFNYYDKMLVKRVIAVGGDVVEIASDGTVTVNGVIQEEPYIDEKSLGSCDLTFPYTVPANHLFVMGDNRQDSIDSRVGMVGPVGLEQVSGKVVLRLWPPQIFGGASG